MPAEQFCRSFLEKALPDIHKKRIFALSCQINSLFNDADLTLRSLGRHLSGKAKVKNKIRMTHRFLNNPGVHQDSFAIYQGLASSYLRSCKEARVAVDWSGCCGRENYLLRASLLHQGRSIPLYNEVHSITQYEDEVVQTQFLDKLHQILPSHIKVIIVTDAGFKSPWFHKVNDLGWYFVGRVRGRVNCRLKSKDDWRLVNKLYEGIKRNTSCYLGPGELGKGWKRQSVLSVILRLQEGERKPKSTRNIRI